MNRLLIYTTFTFVIGLVVKGFFPVKIISFSLKHQTFLLSCSILCLLLSDSVLSFKTGIKIGINYTTALLRKQVPL